MDGIKIGLLAGYGLIRLLPFIITTYLLCSVKIKGEKGRRIGQTISKYIAILMGIGFNGVAFLVLHYFFYRNLVIIGYIKNIWQLNFYHQDVEYFTVSAFVLLLIAVCVGVVLRIFYCNKEKMLMLTRKGEAILLACGFLAFIILLAGVYAKDYYQSKIMLSEILSNNQEIIVDDYYLNCDYIEIYNSGVLPCQIEDLYLSDDRDNLQKMSLQGMVVAGKNVLLIPCVDEVRSFTINSAGESIYLSNAGGKVLEKVILEKMDDDTAYIKTSTDPAKWEIGSCSPGINNDEMIEMYVDAPILSHESGFYQEPFALELKSNEDVTIYYTLDGSIPDEGSHLYEEAINVYDKSEEANVWRSMKNIVLDWENYVPNENPVTKAFIVRALAVDNAGNKSDIVTASYFINCEKYKDRNVISLIADPKDLFDDERGIYVTGKSYDEWYLNGQQGDAPTPLFKKSGMESERNAVFEVFCGLESVMQQEVGIRIQGASAREKKEKRFSVFARNMYSGSNRLQLPFFERTTLPHSVVLRDGFADVLCQALMEDRQIPIQQGKSVRLFLNGEYWYDSYMREKYSKQFFEDYYGIEKEQLILYKSGSLEEGVETDALLYNELYEYVAEEDFSKEETYEKFCEIVDVSNYIDFLASNIYCANMDVDDIKNVVIWRAREAYDDVFADGKWRWALYDMDAVEWIDSVYYEIQDTAEVNSFHVKPQYAAIPYNQNAIYMALKENKEFQQQFVLTFMDLMNENFSVNRVSEKLKEYGMDITWQNSFFEKRPDYMKEYLAQEFSLSGTVETVTLHNETEIGGTVRINSITPVMKNGSWSGEYFTDYPVRVTAIPKDGYRFTGWIGSVNSTEETMEVSLGVGGLELTAKFEKIE